MCRYSPLDGLVIYAVCVISMITVFVVVVVVVLVVVIVGVRDGSVGVVAWKP